MSSLTCFGVSKQRLLIALALSPLMGCMAVPSANNIDAENCEMTTPQWTLKIALTSPVKACEGTQNTSALGCLATFGIVVPAVSTVVSGSVVIVGNTLHWIEYQGFCNEKQIQEKLEMRNDEIQSQRIPISSN